MALLIDTSRWHCTSNQLHIESPAKASGPPPLPSWLWICDFYLKYELYFHLKIKQWMTEQQLTHFLSMQLICAGGLGWLQPQPTSCQIHHIFELILLNKAVLIRVSGIPFPSVLFDDFLKNDLQWPPLGWRFNDCFLCTCQVSSLTYYCIAYRQRLRLSKYLLVFESVRR